MVREKLDQRHCLQFIQPIVTLTIYTNYNTYTKLYHSRWLCHNWKVGERVMFYIALFLNFSGTYLPALRLNVVAILRVGMKLTLRLAEFIPESRCCLYLRNAICEPVRHSYKSSVVQ